MTLGVLALAVVLATSAQAQEACGTYVVQDGDTLGSISMAAYGVLNYQLLFNANVEALRQDLASPPAGTLLRIPCEDGRTTAADPAADSVAADPTVAEPADGDGEGFAVESSYRPIIRMVSGDDWVPFADPSLLDGGLFLRVTQTALERAGPKYRYKVGWVHDWDSHIEVLLPAGAFDIATGWYHPGCDTLTSPSELTLYLCDNFIFSDPIYDSLFGYYGLPGNSYVEANSFADLAGARICRSEGNHFQDLEAQGLVEPNISIHFEYEEDGCVTGVIEDRYDLASFEVQYSEVLFAEMGVEEQIVQSPFLATIQSSAALAHRSNPKAGAYIEHLNRGLAILRESDEWTSIVTSTLAEAAALEATE